jgi:hydrogenase/urease accessory protein HupE
VSRLCASRCWRWPLAAFLLVDLAVFRSAQAHEARPVYLEIEETAPGQYTMNWRTPVLAGTPLPVVLRLPEGVRDSKSPLVQHLSDSVLERRWVDAGPEGLTGKRIAFPGLEVTITDAVVRAELLDGRSWMAVARPSRPWVEIAAARGTLAVARDFVRQGIEHISSGPDHLLFVFGLLLIVCTPWNLVRAITAFTVAHSITLTAATLGYVRPPAPPIEAAIALSIVFLGIEIVRAHRAETSFAIRNPWVVAFVFGLLHGFGFASAMSSAGLPPADVPLALLSFNVGVELGQLTFVIVVLVLARSLRRLRMAWPRPVELLPAYLVGSLGAFWLIQRVALM